MSRAVSTSALDFGLCRRRLCQALYTPGPVRRLSLCAFERGLERPLPNKARARQTDLAWPRRPGATMSTSLGCSAAGTLSQALYRDAAAAAREKHGRFVKRAPKQPQRRLTIYLRASPSQLSPHCASRPHSLE